MNTLITNARIVAENETIEGDLLIRDGVIERIGAEIPAGDAEVVDAAGRYLLPGGVDAHTHFDLDLGAYRATDDFFSGSVAAACGGTTTIVDHLAFGPAGCRLGHQIDVYRGLAEKTVVDYSFHGVIQHVDDDVLRDMETLIGEGITSHKIYMTYGHVLSDADIMRVMERARELDIVICAHCENDAIVGFLARRLALAGRTTARYHPVNRPPECEAESAYRLAMLAAAAGDAPLYVVHLSTALTLDAVRAARQRGSRNIFVETCPQYLLLNEERYDDDSEGLKYIMAPPLRSPANSAALWDGLRRGDIDVVATDHCPFDFTTKKRAGGEGFSRCPGGIPGVEARLALLLSEGFAKGRLSLAEVVRAACETPARIFGLYPRKGVLREGADADMVLYNPDARWVLRHDMLHERVDYTPYEGWEMQGAIERTISRGETVMLNGKFAGTPGRGVFVKRGTSDAISR